MYHGKEDTLLLETTDRLLAVTAYDVCRKVTGYFTIEMKMLGDRARIYLVPTYSWDDLQSGPREGFRDSLSKLHGIIEGVKAGWKAGR